MAANAQPAPEVAIDRAFRYESSAPNLQSQQMLGSLKNWMGAYQRIRKDGDSQVTHYPPKLFIDSSSSFAVGY